MQTFKPLNSRRRLGRYAAALLSLALVAASWRAEAQCTTTNLTINTGEYNYTSLAIGIADPLWTISGKGPAYMSGPPIGANALVVNPLTGWTGTGWISDNQAHANPGVPADSSNFMIFKRNFTLCAGATVNFDLRMRIDNYVKAILVDGVVVPGFSQPYTSSITSYIANFNQTLLAGTHSLEIRVGEDINMTANPVGMAMVGHITAPTSVIVNDFDANCQKYTCGTPCSDTCYWKVAGNNIIGTNNIFGTLTNDNVRIFTNNTSRGIITNTGRFGFGTATPGNRVEINYAGNGNSTNTGFSGLRFSNMNITSVTQPNQGKVLSVDANGDVVLVPDGGGGAANANNGCSMNGSFVQLGQDCKQGATGAELMNDRELPLNSHNLIFRDGRLARYTNRVGIGTNMGNCVPNAKLEVIRNKEDEAYDFLNIAVSGQNHDFSPGGPVVGVWGESDLSDNDINIGGNFRGRNGRKQTVGVYGIAQAQGGYEAYGGWFGACDAQRNIGVYAEACESDHQGGGPNWAGYFNGDVFTTTNYYASDRKIKKNIEPIVNALDLLNRIQPKKYQFDHTVYPALHLPDAKENYGVIAQELETVLPSLVAETPVPNGKNGMLKETIKTVNYTELIPILIQAVKDLEAKVETLKAGSATQGAGNTDIAKTDGYLAQNVPNPFSTSTVIKYQLPAGTQKAAIGIYDMNGKEIRLFQLSAEKSGAITIQGGELKPGMYLYSLIVDGRYFDSKKMILTSN